MSLQRKLKNALDETRLLILGAQVLFGFQFNGMFQEAFADLHLPLRLIACAGLVLVMISNRFSRSVADRGLAKLRPGNGSQANLLLDLARGGFRAAALPQGSAWHEEI
jgi:hypothetical protein